jgi:hypothetical protein
LHCWWLFLYHYSNCGFWNSCKCKRWLDFCGDCIRSSRYLRNWWCFSFNSWLFYNNLAIPLKQDGISGILFDSTWFRLHAWACSGPDDILRNII